MGDLEPLNLLRVLPKKLDKNRLSVIDLTTVRYSGLCARDVYFEGGDLNDACSKRTFFPLTIEKGPLHKGADISSFINSKVWILTKTTSITEFFPKTAAHITTASNGMIT